MSGSIMQSPRQLYFNDDGETPNSRLPVLLYRQVALHRTDKAGAFEVLFGSHQWPAQWRAQVFDYHHYHSTAHEVLGVVSGQALLMLGGPSGAELNIGEGDVLVLPAGTGHCSLKQSADFLVVGAYPTGQENYDIQRPARATHNASMTRIAEVSMPLADPVHGPMGALMKAWAC
ncbi:cupin domain-containing protein [Pseudomonas fluorescens]|uniref:Cupin type-1 domain-containing protein n=1 Tax=Pseudomonas fluorescens TaxID=294 RepID=A0A5E7BWA3_PSEFL|nr:cupin domain-containing protein [Pseudomonas fluorescens]VVN92564.1 hypothetical protein PS691_01984 [Pseudomonas fluorescens]